MTRPQLAISARPHGQSAGVSSGDSNLLYDTFTAANGTNIDGRTPNTGVGSNTWSVINGAQDIQSNQAHCKTQGSSPNASISTYDVAQADVVITAKITLSIANTTSGVAFRITDKANCWMALFNAQGDTFYLYKRESGASLAVDTASVSLSASTEYTIEVTLSGNSISATLDGANTVSTSNSFNATKTKHGLWLLTVGDLCNEITVTSGS